MQNKKIVLLIIISLSITLVACTKGSKENQNYVGETEESRQVKDGLGQANSIDKTDSSTSTNDIEVNENTLEDNTINIVTRIEGRRKEFLEKLDTIQKELDELPEKKDSDAGVTNAMKNYYGRSYDVYDKALNEIYALLKEKLSPETMKNLQTEQIKWIKQKEDIAEKERLKYNGGTFENVAYHASLYELTKKRCYELVNEYMAD